MMITIIIPSRITGDRLNLMDIEGKCNMILLVIKQMDCKRANCIIIMIKEIEEISLILDNPSEMTRTINLTII